MFSKHKIFVIAEIANSHEGDVSRAKKLIESASRARADAVKFQKFTADELVESDHKNHDLFKKLEMTNKNWRDLVKFAKSKNLKVFVDVFGVKSAKEILKLKINGLKIHSSDLTNSILLRFLSTTKYPLLLSIAGAKLNEINESLKILTKNPKEISLMFGFQGYPTNLKDLNLGNILELKRKYDCRIGVSEHVSGDSEMVMISPLLACGLGASIIEKHITLDRSKKGIDFYSALNPNEFKHFVKLVRMTEVALKKTDFFLTKNELKYRQQHMKKTISKSLIKKGTILQEKMFEYKRTKSKQESVPYYDFINNKAAKNILKGAILTKNLIEKNSHKVTAVLACRVGSDRLFAKPLQPVGDFPILKLIINQLKTSKLLNDIVLAISNNSENDIFENFAINNNLRFIRGDDKDVLKRLITAGKFVNADTIFRVTTENPFMFWEGIDNIINKHLIGNYDLTSYKNLPLGSSMEIIKLKALELSHKLGSSKHRSELCTLFINENPKKFKICRIKVKGINRPDLRLTVDTPQDLWVARLIHESLSNNEKPIPLKKIIKFLDNNSKIKTINSDVPIEFKIY